MSESFEEAAESSNGVDCSEDAPGVIRLAIGPSFGGVVIGKGGATIKSIRADTGCKVEVGDRVAGARYRILTLRGEYKALVAAAMRITELVAQQAQQNNRGGQTSFPQGSYRCMILICARCCGCIIGKKGANINMTRDESGAKVNVSSEALPMSSEKTVDIQGEKDNVNMAMATVIGQIVTQYGEQYQPRKTYEHEDIAGPRPGNTWGSSRGGSWDTWDSSSRGSGRYGGDRWGPYGGPDRDNSSSPWTTSGASGQTTAGYGPTSSKPSPRGGGWGGERGGWTTSSPAQDAWKSWSAPGSGQAERGGTTGDENEIIVPVPNGIIGGVIGKGGQNISRVRSQSGAHITIDKEPNAKGERHVTIKGGDHQTLMAVRMIRQLMSDGRF